MKAVASLLIIWLAKNISANFQCESDKGPRLPQNGQIFYIEAWSDKWETRLWMYPASVTGLIKHGNLPKEELLDAANDWPKWKWHECSDGYVAFESRRKSWHNYYMSIRGDGVMEAWYSANPCSVDWTKFKIEPTPGGSGRRVGLMYKSHANGGYLAELYIPPMCEITVSSHQVCNCGNNNATYTVTHEYGISSTKAESSGLSSTITGEIESAIKLAASIPEADLLGGRLGVAISQSWMHESSKTWTQKSTSVISMIVPPKKELILEYKVAIYGRFNVVSNQQLKFDDSNDCDRC